MKILIGLLSMILFVLSLYLLGCLFTWEKPFNYNNEFHDTGERIGIGFFISAAIAIIIFIAYNIGDSF